MLSKKFKIIKKTRVLKVVKKGQKFYTPFFKFYFLPNFKLNSRFLVSISKKVYKSAVKRNRIRHKLEFVLSQSNNPLFNLKNKQDFLIQVVDPKVLNTKTNKINMLLFQNNFLQKVNKIEIKPYKNKSFVKNRQSANFQPKKNF